MASGITIVGLGPGDPALITRQAWEALTESDKVFLRTKDHPSIESIHLDGEVESFDELYTDSETFEHVYQGIVDRLIAECQSSGEVLYAVPGDPTVGEATTGALQAEAAHSGIPFQIIHGVSFIEPCLGLLGVDALDGLVVFDALELMDCYHPGFPPDQHVLISQVHSQLVASDVKLTLMNQYPEDHEVAIIQAAGSQQAELERMQLYQLDRHPTFDSLTCLYLTPMEQGASFESFQELVAHLRSPQGCPWDREQTHLTLRQHMLEEAYEALEAIDSGDPEELREELGDLMLQLVLQTQIAVEEGEFLMVDVLGDIHRKLVRRHPHVFEGVDVDDVPEVLSNWEGLKAIERQSGGLEEGALAGVPLTLPALAQAEEYQSRAARLGFDWPQQSGVLAKIDEELEEVARATGNVEKSAELGDLLFAVVNYARWLEVDPEAALREANSRFKRRFRLVEQKVEQRGERMDQLNIDQLETYWQQAKREAGEA